MGISQKFVDIYPRVRKKPKSGMRWREGLDNICPLLIAILATGLMAGCATKTTEDQWERHSMDPSNIANTERKEKDFPIQENVIKGGLGYSFDLLYKDLNLNEYKIPIEIKKFGEVKKVNPKEFFPVVVLKFTPISGKLYSIHGIKLYVSRKTTNLGLPCADDLYTLSKTINSKYPSLKKYTTFGPIATNYKDHIGHGYAPRTKPYKFGSKTYTSPKGRYVEVECFKSKQSSILTIQYIDDDTRKLSRPEHKRFLKEKHQEILKQKGINPNKI